MPLGTYLLLYISEHHKGNNSIKRENWNAKNYFFSTIIEFDPLNSEMKFFFISYFVFFIEAVLASMTAGITLGNYRELPPTSRLFSARIACNVASVVFMETSLAVNI